MRVGATSGWLAVATVMALAGASLRCGDPTDCATRRVCADADDGGDGGGVVPSGCDPAGEPKDQPACVVDGFGVFVDGASGSDTNEGTKAAPLKTIGAALSKAGAAKRVYVCEGSYAERVKVTSAVSLYGGFTCADWSYSGAKAKLAPTEEGIALEVDGVSAKVLFADLDVVAKDATKAGESSIAAWVRGSADVTFVRCALTAGKGADGAAGAAGDAPLAGGALNGNQAEGTSAGGGKSCNCPSGLITSGGAGGAPGGDGQNGGPSALPENPPGLPVPKTGKGGLNASTLGCTYPGGLGLPGADAPSGESGTGAGIRGTLTTSWSPAGGTSGKAGVAGQGGGGGGGRTGAGGGGACGGCGATGGAGGAGGGASLALICLDSAVKLSGANLSPGVAGTGGAGGTSVPGGDGGFGGFGAMPNGCNGGDGGRGGNGGSGGGGAGGISVGVLYKGQAPVLEATTITKGTAGAKGIGGTPGVNDGIDGIAAETFEAP